MLDYKLLLKNKTILGINRRNIELISPNNPRKYYKLADDKHQTKEILHKNNIACAKTFAIIKGIGEIYLKWQQIPTDRDVVIKPACGKGGGGILILKRKNGNWYEGKSEVNVEYIFRHIANIIFGIYSIGDQDKAIVEECIVTHQFYSGIYDNGVPDFRIILYKNIPAMAMLRYPTKKSNGKANIHQGGLGIGVELETGVLKQAYDGEKYHDNHPDTGKQIVGKKVPLWNKIIDLSIQTSSAFPLDYLGIDVIIDKNKGPIVMEINIRPGLAIQLANKTGFLQELNKI